MVSAEDRLLIAFADTGVFVVEFPTVCFFGKLGNNELDRHQRFTALTAMLGKILFLFGDFIRKGFGFCHGEPPV
jgi:hypothetical protein